MTGRLAPRRAATRGGLAASGGAPARRAVTSLPPLADVPVWIQAVTVDPKAPLGLRTIADPVRLTVGRGAVARGWIGGGKDGWQTGNAPPAGRGPRSFYLPRDVVADGFGSLYVVDGDRIAWWRG